MDEVLLSISLADGGKLVKMLITLESHGIFESNFAYLFILTLFSRWYEKWWRGCWENLKRRKLAKITKSMLNEKKMQIEIISNNILKTCYRNFARPAGVHCNHCVSPSVRPICFLHIPSGTGY